jgi:REP element-mobilizing transposase RayT
MPQFDDFPYPRRHNTLGLLGYEYNSIDQLCAITMVVSSRRPLFGDMLLAKATLTSLLSDETLEQMRLRAFTLMPDHLHFIAGVREPEQNLRHLIGEFKSFTTQLYWKRSREIVHTQQVSLPSTTVIKSKINESHPLLSALIEGRAVLRPEVVELRNWPSVSPDHFLKKTLWQTRFYDHVIRNDHDLWENLKYIEMNPVRKGFVSHPFFYPYTGFLPRARLY